MIKTKALLVFLFSLAGFSLSTAFGHFPDGNWTYEEAERWLKAPGRKSHEIEAGALLLAEKYEADGRVQEAIWTLRIGGHYEKTDALESRLLERLSRGSMTFVKAWHGTDESRKYKIGEGELYGVFKSSNHHYIKEVVAYRLDQLLRLDIVPMTVIRNHSGYGTGSLQYFVRNTTRNSGREDSVDFRRNTYPKSQKNMWLLDFLLDNSDRNERNWLKRFGDLPVAIDHGHTLGRIEPGKAKIQENTLPDGAVLRRLMLLKHEDFKGIDLDISPIFKRRDEILERVEQIRPGVRCQIIIAS